MFDDFVKTGEMLDPSKWNPLKSGCNISKHEYIFPIVGILFFTNILSILSRLAILQSQIDDMKDAVKSDVENKDLKDEDMFRIKEKMKDLEADILRIIEG